jgi:hypothetical protein
MKPCWFHPEALAEADEAAAFYKEQQSNLEVRFLEALNDTISRIKKKPTDLSSHPRGSKKMSGTALSLWRHIPRR